MLLVFPSKEKGSHLLDESMACGEDFGNEREGKIELKFRWRASNCGRDLVLANPTFAWWWECSSATSRLLRLFLVSRFNQVANPSAWPQLQSNPLWDRINHEFVFESTGTKNLEAQAGQLITRIIRNLISWNVIKSRLISFLLHSLFQSSGLTRHDSANSRSQLQRKFAGNAKRVLQRSLVVSFCD